MVTLVKEDGTGLSNANSYGDQAGAAVYWADRTEPSAWTASTSDEMDIALVETSAYLNATFSGRWRGVRILQAMAMHWPRNSAYDDDGYLYDDDALPVALEHATYELAAKIRADGSLLADVDAASAGTIASERVKVGPIEEEIRYTGGKGSQKIYTMASRILRQLIEPAGEISRS